MKEKAFGEEELRDLLARVRAAQMEFSTYSQEKVDKSECGAYSFGGACRAGNGHGRV